MLCADTSLHTAKGLLLRRIRALGGLCGAVIDGGGWARGRWVGVCWCVIDAHRRPRCRRCGRRSRWRWRRRWRRRGGGRSSGGEGRGGGGENVDAAGWLGRGGGRRRGRWSLRIGRIDAVGGEGSGAPIRRLILHGQESPGGVIYGTLHLSDGRQWLTQGRLLHIEIAEDLQWWVGVWARPV